MSVSTILTDYGDLRISGGRFICSDETNNISLNCDVNNSIFPQSAGAISIGVGVPDSQDPAFSAGSIYMGTSAGFNTSTADSVNAQNSIFIGTQAGATLNLNTPLPNGYKFIAIGEKALTNVGVNTGGVIQQCVAIGYQAGSTFNNQTTPSLAGGLFLGSKTGVADETGTTGLSGVVVLNGNYMNPSNASQVAYAVPPLAALTTRTTDSLNVGFYCTLPQFDNTLSTIAGLCPVYYQPPDIPSVNPMGQLIAGPVQT